MAEAQPLEEGWSFALDDMKLTVKGTFHTDKAEDELGECCLILQNENEALHYALTRMATQGESGLSVAAMPATISPPAVSAALPQGRYQVLVELDGVVYDSGYYFEA